MKETQIQMPALLALRWGQCKVTLNYLNYKLKKYFNEIVK